MRVTAVLACHNRRARTLECLASYYAQETTTPATLSAVLVDDGSSDGTAVAVREWFPATNVIEGDGNLFWARAMALAEQVALSQEDPDYLLWLNDDVVLDQSALSRLVATAGRNSEACIAVGALRDPVTKEIAYSGVRRRGLHPLRMDLVTPADEPIEVETFNGNVVLVPRSAATRIGPIDGALVHAAADFDYGLRAREAGVSNLLAPGTVGDCALNPAGEPWLDPNATTRQRFGIMVGPKGLPPRARARYLMRHGGPIWFLFWLSSYIRAVPSIVRSARSTRSPR